MIKPVYINSSCVISNYTAYKDGVPVFKNDSAGTPEFLLALYQHIGLSYPKFYKMDMLCKLGLLASEILLDRSVKPDKYAPYETGVILTNSQSSLDADCKYYETMNTNPSPSLFVYTLPNILIGELCIRNKIKGESAFFVFEKFNPEFLRKYVENLFNNDNLQACICGWVDLSGDVHKAVLFYLEKENSDKSVLFDLENINKIYQIQNG